jgi:hypothetical protein
MLIASATSSGPICAPDVSSLGAEGTQEGTCTKTCTGWLQGLIHHQAHPAQAKHIGNLMRIDEHAGRAARKHRPHKLSHRQHTRFDMHMGIDQAGESGSARRIDQACLRSKGMRGIRPNISHPAIDHGYIGAWHKLTGLDTYPHPVADDQIRRQAAHGAI